MLNEFLEVVYESEQKKEAQVELVEQMKKLPNTELAKLAFGSSGVKEAFYDTDEEWLDKFKGSPLFERAAQLEEQLLQIQMSQQQNRQSQRDMSEEFHTQRDQICLQKKLLGLELAKMEQTEVTGQPPLPEPAADPAAAAGPPAAPEAPAAAPAAPEAKVGSASYVGSSATSLGGRETVAPQTKTETRGGETRSQGAGALGAFNPTFEDHYDNTAGSEAKAASAVVEMEQKIASADELARKLARADSEKAAKDDKKKDKKPPAAYRAGKSVGQYLPEATGVGAGLLGAAAGSTAPGPLSKIRGGRGIGAGLGAGLGFLGGRAAGRFTQGVAEGGPHRYGKEAAAKPSEKTEKEFMRTMRPMTAGLGLGGAAGAGLTAYGGARLAGPVGGVLGGLTGLVPGMAGGAYLGSKFVDKDKANALAAQLKTEREAEKGASAENMLEEIGKLAGQSLAGMHKDAGVASSAASKLKGLLGKGGPKTVGKAPGPGAAVAGPAGPASGAPLPSFIGRGDAPLGNVAVPRAGTGAVSPGALPPTAMPPKVAPRPAAAAAPMPAPAPPPPMPAARPAAPAAAGTPVPATAAAGTPAAASEGGLGAMWAGMTPQQKLMATGVGAGAGGLALGKAASVQLLSYQPHLMQKEALVGKAIGEGLKGMGKFLGTSAGNIKSIQKAYGAKGVGAALPHMARGGVTRAAEFAKANPLAAGAIGVGGLGAAGATGAALG
jgi:hypothetical protein